MYEYNVEYTGNRRDGRTYVSDPAGSDYFMRPLDGPDIAWYTNPLVSQGIIDDKFDNGKASDLCRIEHANDAL